MWRFVQNFMDYRLMQSVLPVDLKNLGLKQFSFQPLDQQFFRFVRAPHPLTFFFILKFRKDNSNYHDRTLPVIYRSFAETGTVVRRCLTTIISLGIITLSRRL